ncbi:hypothetical protein IX306_001138 [Porphyromonas levii]|nr:hypothetical protein [Porphyromonas levii]
MIYRDNSYGIHYPYLGYKFSDKEKTTLQTTGNLGKVVQLTPKNGEPFSAYVSIDPLTNELVALRADRVSIPKEIKGVELSDQQYKDLVEGKSVKVEGMPRIPKKLCGLNLSEKQQQALTNRATLYLKNLVDKVLF